MQPTRYHGIVHLEDVFEGITYHSAITVVGTVKFPAIQVGVNTIMSEIGSIDCCFMLDTMNLQITKDFKKAIGECDIIIKQAEKLSTLNAQLKNEITIHLKLEKELAIAKDQAEEQTAQIKQMQNEMVDITYARDAMKDSVPVLL